MVLHYKKNTKFSIYQVGIIENTPPEAENLQDFGVKLVIL